MSAKYPDTGGFADSSWAGPVSYEGEDPIAAVHRLNSVARDGGILAKEQAVGVLAGVVEGIVAATQVLAYELRHAGYAYSATDAVYVAATSLNNAAGQLGHAKAEITRLLDTKLGQLASSGQQVPDDAELNGGH